MHKYFMQAALEQAWLGRGNCAPNPSVGAVAVHKGEIIARAWHQGAGTAHAEQLILKQIQPGIKDLSLYVTLEPCNHWGKTPPCVAGIIDYGVSLVVYGHIDPNPLVAANNTPQILNEKGVAVLHYPLPEIDSFYESYRYWSLTKKPWITVKIAQSLDGKIAGKDGQRILLSNAECAEFTHKQRYYMDAILTTATTVNNDNPLLNARLNQGSKEKVLIILDRNLSLSAEAKIFTAAKHCHIYYDENAKLFKPHANCSYHAVPVKNSLLDLPFIVQHLGKLGFHDIWVEAGGQLFSALHRERLVQRTYLYVTPSFLGSEALSAFNGEAIFTGKPKVKWQVMGDNVRACFDWQEDLCSQES
jgi:diaminohydroxyphosphoribosylaminopyrimidine deaminase / 5-amino-6-(5-phosphoribosylamino)uracil reductase